MATTPQQAAQSKATARTRSEAGPSTPGEKSSLPALVLLVGWLIPGAGHLLLGKWVRALLLFAAIMAMYIVGLNMQGKIYLPNTGDVLDILGFVGQLGLGALYFLARVFGWGATTVVTVFGDYGTKFLVVGGLLNLISAVDAHSLANGRKPSLAGASAEGQAPADGRKVL